MDKVVAILQARMGSSRLPGKMLMDVEGQTLLQRTLERSLAIRGVDQVVLATTTLSEDEQLIDIAQAIDVSVFAGDPDDVLDRYRSAARSHSADVVMRLTGDCPLLDPSVCESVVARFAETGVDYASNVIPPTYPDGLDTEVFSFAALETAWKESNLNSDREHVTQFIRRQPARFRQVNVANDLDLSALRWTVDEIEDLDFVRKIYQGLYRRGWRGYAHSEILKVIQVDGLQDASHHFQRDEGLLKSLRKDAIAPRGGSDFSDDAPVINA